MGIAVTSVRIGNPERERFLGSSLARLRTPKGEDWAARIGLCRGGWELQLSGPIRHTLHVGKGWDVVTASADRALYRRHVGPQQQSAEGVLRVTRALLWDGIQFHENGIGRSEPPLGQAFEDAVWDALTRGTRPRVEVRLEVWPEETAGPRYVCSLEFPQATGLGPRSTWRRLVRTPRELGDALASSAFPDGARPKGDAAAPAETPRNARSSSPPTEAIHVDRRASRPWVCSTPSDREPLDTDFESMAGIMGAA